jgi:hypothetical protein
MRRSRSFWEARVAELGRGRSVDWVASRHGLTPARLRWWRWRIGAGPGPVTAAPRMIEVVARAAAAPTSATDHDGVRILVGPIVLELPAGTTPEYVGRVVAAVRATC